MKRTRMFRALWRVNAVLIFAVGVVTLCFLLYAGCSLVRERFQPIQRNDLVTNTESRGGQSHWELGAFERVAGTDTAIAPEYSVQNYRLSFKDKTASATRNYLLLDLRDKSSRWLLPKHERLILSKREICASAQSDGTWERPCKSVKWLAFEMVAKDTDGDGQLSASDRVSLGFSNADGEGFGEVITDADRIGSLFRRDADTVVVVYSAGGKDLVAEIDIAGRKVTSTNPLPQVGDRK